METDVINVECFCRLITLTVILALWTIWVIINSSAIYSALFDNGTLPVAVPVSHEIPMTKSAKITHSPNFLPSTTTTTTTTKQQLFNVHEFACGQFWPNANCSSKILQDKQFDWMNHLSNYQNMSRVLLIVYYNNRRYETAAKVHAIYYRVFGDVVFCGPDEDEEVFWSMIRNIVEFNLFPSVKFIPYGKYGQPFGENAYLCLPFAVDSLTNLANYDGVLVIAEDVIFNYWDSKKPSLERNWLLKTTNDVSFDIDSSFLCKGIDANNSVDCQVGWESDLLIVYQENIRQLYEHLDALYLENYNNFGSPQIKQIIATRSNNGKNEEWPTYWRLIKEKLLQVTGGHRRLLTSDSAAVFYISKQYIRLITPLLEVFGRSNIPLEIAVPTAVKTVSFGGDIDYLQLATINWGETNDANYSSQYYDAHQPFELASVNSYLVNEPKSETKDALMTSCAFCNLLNLASLYEQKKRQLK